MPSGAGGEYVLNLERRAQEGGPFPNRYKIDLWGSVPGGCTATSFTAVSTTQLSTGATNNCAAELVTTDCSSVIR